MEDSFERKLVIIFWSICGVALLLGIVEAVLFHGYKLLIGTALITLVTIDISTKGGKIIGDFVFIIIFIVLAIGGIKNMVTSKPSPSYTLYFNAEEVLNMTGSTGDKFVLYDESTKSFSSNYIPPDKLAKKQEEIAGVILLEKGSEYVGSYANGASGHRQYYKLSLLSTKTGEIIARTTVYGSSPPSSIRANRSDRMITGNEPSYDKVAASVSYLINK